MLINSKYEFYFSLIEIINKFIPFREALNVIKIALNIIKNHLFTLTGGYWYFIIFTTFIASITTIVVLFYLQRNNNNNSILRHIKLRHNWVLYETPEYPKYCTKCSGIIKKRFLLMRNYEGWQCSICKRISHMHCIMQSDSEYCKDECSSNYLIKSGSYIKFNNKNSSSNNASDNFDGVTFQQKIHYHVLLKGNLHSGAICSLCRTVCFSPFGLYGQKCIWCNRTYHDECAENKKINQQQCDLGTLKYIILPPNSFVFELYSLEKGENSTVNTKPSIFDKEDKNNFNSSNLIGGKINQLNSTPIENIIQANLTNSSNRKSVSHYIQIFHKSNLIKKKLRFFDDFINANLGKPLLVFVNTKSGGHLGQGLIKNLYIYLNPIQIVDIQNSKGPDEALYLFKHLAEVKKLMILVCGGDGTVRWVIDRCREIYGVNSNNLPPIAVLPLGTGNDLSRTLGWDVTFNGDILNFLKKICTSNIKQMDIWTCTAWDLKNEDTNNSNDYHHMLFSSTFINYLDIGIAARIALKFHNLREAYPQHFKSRLGNQLVYGEVGFRDFFNKSIQLDGLKIFCDGREVTISNHVGSSFLSKSEESINSLGVRLLNENNYFQTYYNLLIIYKSIIKKYINWFLSRVADIFGLGSSLIYCEINKKTVTEINSHFHPRENRLEGLVICNIPSFSGGVNLWKISNQISKKSFKNRDSSIIRRTTTLTSRKIGKGLSDRSMSFSVDNFKNSGYLSCSDSEFSEYDEACNTELKLREGRRKSTNLLKSWFSKAFKQGQFPQLNDSEINDEHIKLGISNFHAQKIDDGLIEVVGIRSLFHLTQLQVGLTEPIKLCQGSNIVIYIPRQLPFQVDGEPRIINKCKLIIELSGKIPVICSEKIENALSLSVQNALEQAVQKKIINTDQKAWITEQIIQEN
ncbi:diacylglycerol kinase [Cryptosporidium ubiquitum]|uniref:Diacylglycerol kinase n=1 Tax=Cryptosporidium ubiquitum TaxID=857276 RepID=A0A1J4MMY0_9CRYT|nr:diacylglycerol kinase [Cryptosporidium ubiquitum]OII74229.1 diacylglycerol kinase [Cryptosporidium ubiquitum]